jgi:hypothetical protein
MNDDLMSALLEQGWLHLHDVSRLAFDEIAGSLGCVFYKTDVRLEPGSNQYAFRPQRFPLHMDAADAEFVCWYVVDAGQGECPMLVADTRPYLERLAQSTREILSSITITYQEIKTGGPGRVPLLQKHERGHWFANYFPTDFRRIVPRNPAESEVLAGFERELAGLATRSISLREKDAIVLDNRRVMHGRGPMRPGSTRHLLRYWIDCEHKYDGLEAAPHDETPA